MNENELKQNLSRNLTFYRKRLGLTQSALAEKIAYTDKSVSKWERGEGVPDALVVARLAAIFEISVDDLLASEPPKRNVAVGKKHVIIGLLAVGLVWLVAAITYFVLGLCLPASDKLYLCFVFALPVSAIVTLVFAVLWWTLLIQGLSVTALLWTLALSLNCAFKIEHMSYVYIVAVVMQVLTILWFVLMRLRKK